MDIGDAERAMRFDHSKYEEDPATLREEWARDEMNEWGSS